MEIARRRKDVAAIGRGHRLLLFGTDHEHRVVDSARNELNRLNDCEAARGAGALDVGSRQAAEGFVDLGQERAEMQLTREKSGCKIPDHAGPEVLGIETGSA